MRLQECLPRSCAFVIRCRFNTVGSENVADRGVADVVADVGQRTLDSVVTPGPIFLGELQGQINNHLADSWSTYLLLLSIGVVPLLCDKLSMPTQNRIRRKQGAESFKLLAAEDFPFDGQSSALVVTEQDAFLAELLFENCVLGSQILDHFLLLAIDPSGKDQDKQLPRLQNEFHRRFADQAKPRRSLGVGAKSITVAKRNLERRQCCSGSSDCENLAVADLQAISAQMCTGPALRIPLFPALRRRLSFLTRRHSNDRKSSPLAC